MFTGIINHLGYFHGYSLGKKILSIEAPSLMDNLGIGESLAVNGVCLSLVKKEKHILSFDISEETYRQTNLGALRKKDMLNLELPVTLSTLLSGHIVTGHVDSTGKVLKILSSKNGKRFTFSFPDKIRPYLVPKGSVCINGVSLTIAAIHSLSFNVEIIPITLQNSNLGVLQRGAAVNIESDIFGKYVYNWQLKHREE